MEPPIGISGFLIIDKPEGRSSSFIDFLCKKILKIKKAGHIGTLDPFATGVLPIALNNATKAIPYISSSSKTYEFQIKFGEKTDSGDKTGKIIKTMYDLPLPKDSDIEKVIPKFIGEISQIPSAVSAIKISGRPAYELVRKGETPKMKPRKVTIFDLDYLGDYRFRATVSPGTYIRSLSEDIAKELGTIAHTLSLRRTRDGRFNLKDCISIDWLEKMAYNIESFLVPLENVLDDIPVILISCLEAEALIHGKSVTRDPPALVMDKGGIYLASSPEIGFLEIVEVSLDGVISPKRLLLCDANFERSIRDVDYC